MEVVPKKLSVVKEERSRMESSLCVGVEEVEKIRSEKKKRGGDSIMSSSPDQSYNQEDQLESTKAEMGEVREENERLKTLLARIAKDYQSLQMQFFDISQQDQAKKPAETPSPPPQGTEEPEFISLSLGTSSSWHKKEEKTTTTTNTASKGKDSDKIEEGLTLGLDSCKYEGSSTGPNEPVSSNSVEEAKEEEGEPWPPSKIVKNSRSAATADDEVSQQPHVKKTRVSVRARCDAPTMHDGCQWRKYGQKIAKGNPCPRGYYRCTVAPQCPVRKQVQRCADDMSILITTYEGTHNHPLPISATAMASTTSAAASMLMSGSSTSWSPLIGSLPSSSSIPASASNTHALNFNTPNPRSHPFYLPNPTFSSTPSHPTITLDLTSPPQTTPQASQLNRFSSNFSTPTHRYSTSFNFSSTTSESSSSTSLQTSWNPNGSYLNYATSQAYNKSPMGSLGLVSSSQQDSLYQSYLQKITNPMGTQHVLTDTLAKVITSDPSFQSALAAAITTYVGEGPNAAQKGGDGPGLGLKWGDQHGPLAPFLTPPSANGCGSSLLKRTRSGSGSNPQQGNWTFLQPALGISSSKSASASPVDSRENIN